MNIEEKAKKQADLIFAGESFERSWYTTGIKKGYKFCIEDITEFIRVNPKSTTSQITEYLNSL